MINNLVTYSSSWIYVLVLVLLLLDAGLHLPANSLVFLAAGHRLALLLAKLTCGFVGDGNGSCDLNLVA